MEFIPKTALLLGATGMVGRELLHFLLDCPEYQQVVAITRTPLDLVHPKLYNPVLSLDRLPEWNENIAADHAFCCIGTTMAKAGSQEAFKKVDYEYVVSFAKRSRQLGAEKFVLVSSLGADEKSPVFYSRIKGETEKAIRDLHFKQTVVFRPSILLGNRTENRPGEAVGRWVAEKFSFLFAGPLAKYRGVEAQQVARAMIYIAKTDEKEYRIVENEEIPVLAAHYQ